MTDDPPVVLAVDDDEKILETYEIWFGTEYDLRTATGGQEALDRLDDDVQVVLLDRLMPGLSGDEVLDRIREREVDCRVAMVTAVEPDFDIAEMPFDTYVTKALDRETVEETVERLVARSEYDDLLRRQYALAEKLATLEERKPEADLATSEEYRELSEAFEALCHRLEESDTGFDRSDLVQSIDDLNASVRTPGPDDTREDGEL
jgi:DNA-binding response OmpR family regulator